jgi:hypothetical protein
LEAKANDTATGPGPRHRHETQDTPVSGIVWLGAVFVVLLIGGMLVSLWDFGFFTRHQPLGPPPTPFQSSRPTPPAPQLQVAPEVDWQNYMKQQLQTGDSYGWVDRKAGIVRIPIDRAMDLVLKRGLPVRGQQGPAEASRAARRSARPASEGSKP